MAQSLATLRRRSTPVAVHDRGTLPDVMLDAPLVFRRTSDAELYLRFWKGDAGGMSALRALLVRVERGTDVGRLSDERVIDSLARHFAAGLLVAAEGPTRMGKLLGLPNQIEVVITPETATAVAPIADVALPAGPEIPAPLLPILEEVQIEGADVLPEVEQTLEQIDLTMAQIDAAKAALDPAPSGVSAISSSITDASSSVTGTLDAL